MGCTCSDWIGFNWLRMGSSSGLLWTRQWTLLSHKREVRICCTAVRLLASQKKRLLHGIGALKDKEPSYMLVSLFTNCIESEWSKWWCGRSSSSLQHGDGKWFVPFRLWLWFMESKNEWFFDRKKEQFFLSRSSSKCYLRIQSVPQREHYTSPLQRSTG
jgi:hypothetical protein